MNLLGAYGLNALGGLASATQGNSPNSLAQYMGWQQSSLSQEEAMRQHVMAMQARMAQYSKPPMPAYENEAPKKPKRPENFMSLRLKLQHDTDKWLAGVLDA